VLVRLLRGRSWKQNAFYWHVLEQAVASTGRWRTPQELHAALRIATGYVDEVTMLTGRRVLVPRSTGFAAMTQDEAQAYYDAAFTLLSDTIGVDIHELDGRDAGESPGDAGAGDDDDGHRGGNGDQRGERPRRAAP
jgi:hypothetical protein